MKTLILLVLFTFPFSLFAQDDNGASLAFRARAKRAATEQLEQALKNKDWKLVKESAEQLDQLEKQEKKPKGEGENLFQLASGGGFSLSRSPDEDKKGARFGFSHDYTKSSRTVLEADFYLKWATIPWHNEKESLWNSLAVSAQGKLTSANNSASDAWRFRLEDSLWTYNSAAERSIDGFVATLSAKSESDRAFNTNRLSAELWLTVNARNFLVGQYSGKNDDFVQFRWRPYLGLDAGGTISDEAAKQASSPLWLMARGRADLRLNFLSKMCKVTDVVVYLDDKFVRVTEADKSHNYLDTGVDFELTDNVGLTLQYTVGEDSPKFLHQKVFNGGLTVKF
jgi:hypothetical protein